ncbi:protein Jade-1 isoform X2 [Rhinoraja longicauda]
MDNEIMKRRKFSISSEDSDTTDSHITLWSRGSISATTKHPWARQEEKKPSEVFRTDLITAMKLPESYQLTADEYYVLADPWRQEWEKGVQVPANTESIPELVVRVSPEFEKTHLAPTEEMLASLTGYETSEPGHLDMKFSPRGMCRYDLDEVDVHWLELVNAEFQEAGMLEVNELMMEKIIEELESQCQENMNQAIATEEGLGIEYDEDVVCDVCRSPEGEDGNEMVFCDKCNICVHQACYGILKVPLGSWLCRTCALGVQPKCLLCPKRGGALKPTRSGTKWVHVSCALWIPEVSIGCPEKMEPITKVSHIPASRWALPCSLCVERTGTCIQCSKASCITAFHVTCAFDRNLEMRTILAQNDEVKFKSYCLEHSSTPTSCPARREIPDGVDQSQRDLEKANLRKQKLQQLEDEFYELVKPTDVAQELHVSGALVDFFYQYWRLKRKSNFNKPLLAPKTDEVDNLAQQEQDILYRRLRLFTHLRQDLERVRNLCYMVTRREKMKRSVSRLQEQIFHHQAKLIEENLYRGLSTSISLDGDLLQSWLAQTVQVKTENLLSHWSFRSGPGSEGAESYLAGKLPRDEPPLLSFGAVSRGGDPEPDDGKSKPLKDRGGIVCAKNQCKKDYSQDGASWRANSGGLSALGICTNGPKGPGSKANGSHKRPGEVRKISKRQGPHHSGAIAATSSLAVSHASEIGETLDYFESALPKPSPSVKVPKTSVNPKSWVTFKIPKARESVRRAPGARQAAANGRQADSPERGGKPGEGAGPPRPRPLLDSEADGYFSDAEMSDSDTESTLAQKSQRMRRLGSESMAVHRKCGGELVRRSILAS